MEKKYDLDFFIEWINSFNWTNAKSYADKAPHEYLVRKHLGDEDGLIMVEFAKYIKQNGYVEYFYQTPFTYLNIGEFKYWTMDYPLYKTTIVNRCMVQNKYG